MVIETLKIEHPGIYKLALEQQALQGNEKDASLSIKQDKNNKNFNWDATKQGFSFWRDIYASNFKTYYKIHPKKIDNYSII